jgi:hypothetical protein
MNKMAHKTIPEKSAGDMLPQHSRRLFWSLLIDIMGAGI